MNSLRSRHISIYTVFFISGAVGLAYQIVWARQLSLLLGVSIYAVSAVLVAFLGGLGLGSEIFGRLIDKGARCLRLYAGLEIALGVYVLLFPFLLGLMEKVYLLLHSGNEGVSFYLIVLRLTLAIILLAVPTILMGGTLPALSRYMADSKKDAGSSVGKLYAVNTFGAMTGCVAAGFLMIELFGLSETLRIGAVINLLIGFFVWIVLREKEGTPARVPDIKKDSGVAKDGMLVVLFGVSGFCALALEVLWTRVLVLLLNNTTYAFAMILTIFLMGIGAGSAVMARPRWKSVNGGRLFAFFQVGIGFFAILSLAGLSHSSFIVETLNSLFGSGNIFVEMIPGGERLVPAILFSFFIVFPSTFLMGGGMPLIVKTISFRADKLGGEVGRLYAVNTLGCVLGSLFAGYFLIPMLGVHKSIVIISLIAVASGVYLLNARYKKESRVWNPAFAVIIIPLTLFILRSDVGYLLSVQKLDGGSTVLFYEEGPSAAVMVSSTPTDMSIGHKPVKRIWINGDPIAGVFREALQLERLQAHIPLLLHHGPKSGLVICFGTGSTAGAALAHGLDDITVVDISPEVFRAGSYFADGNMSLLDNGKARLIEEDGRSFLLTSKRKFDFISSEPPPPSNAGVVSLYTKEYYLLHKDRLKKGGIVSQWIPLHHLSKVDFKMLVAAFLESFRYVDMWYTKWDAIMIGSDDKIGIDVERIRERMEKPEIKASLEEIGVTNVYQLVSDYMMNKEQLKKFVDGVKPLYDDWPVVEFTSPRVGDEGVAVKGDNLAGLLRYRKFPDGLFASDRQRDIFKRYFESQSIFFAGQVEKSNGKKGRAAGYYNRSLKVNSDNLDARYANITLNLSAITSAVASGKAEMGLRMLEDTERLDSDGWFASQLHFLKGMFFAKAGMALEAEQEFKAAISVEENYFLGLVNLAGLYASSLNRPLEAEKLYRKALSLSPSKDERKAIVKMLERLKN